MSSKTTSPDVPVDEPSTAQAPPGTDVDSLPEDAVPNDDDLPFESPEFGVGQFFPHLDAQGES